MRDVGYLLDSAILISLGVLIFWQVKPMVDFMLKLPDPLHRIYFWYFERSGDIYPPEVYGWYRAGSVLLMLAGIVTGTIFVLENLSRIAP